MLRNFLLSTALLIAAPAFAERLLIASAANFKPALGIIAAAYEQQTGHAVVLSSAATGVIYNQIVHGAPFDLFLAADALHPRLLEESGLALADTRITYAYGLLILAYQPQLAGLAESGLANLLQAPGLSLVIANPQHAPYGQAAMSALEQVPAMAERRLLRASNVGQAYQMWYSGGADLALVGLSARPAHYLEIPTQWYAPLEQQAVILKQAAGKAIAHDFLAFLQSPAAIKIIRDQGYATESPQHG